MFAKLNRKSRCCDPFGCHKTTITKEIRNATDKAKFHFPHLTDDDKLCTKCRKQIAALPVTRQDMVHPAPPRWSPLTPHFIGTHLWQLWVFTFYKM